VGMCSVAAEHPLPAQVPAMSHTGQKSQACGLKHTPASASFAVIVR